MDEQVRIKTVVCSSCNKVISTAWRYCPNCGQQQRVVPHARVGIKKRKGFKWCPICKTNRLTQPMVFDGHEFHISKSDFCTNCGTGLEETEVIEECPACPTCGFSSKKLNMMNVTLTGDSPSPMQVYCCTNRKCTMSVPYPDGDVSWRTEFVEKNGKRHLVRPAASEFS